MNDQTPHFDRDLPTSGIHVALIEAVADILRRLELNEIDVTFGDLKIRVTRQPFAAAPAVIMPPALPTHSPISDMAPPPHHVDNAGAVKSPMVGTAYLRPSPDAPPFAKVDSKVKAGDRILLIEAMKTFNEIIAPREGTVTAIFVEDGQPVEYGQSLLVIE
jgi:acetyl-CoA carboxylase biotin carboxyl carrier protein